jgi:hypothetical protein
VRAPWKGTKPSVTPISTATPDIFPDFLQPPYTALTTA